MYILALPRRDSSRNTNKSTKSKKCPGRASPAPFQHQLWLLLLLINLLLPKTMETDTGAFSTKDSPQPR